MSLKIYSGLNNVAMEEAKSILAKPSLWIQRIFNEQGELLSNITYYQNGIKNDEHLYFPDQKKEHIRYYYKNGTLRSELYKENGLNNDRDILVKTIADNLVASYEKLRKARDGKAMVPINRNACGYCYNQLPPQFVVEVKQNNSIKNCDSCGVFLYYEEEVVEN